jgi:hypothetical protein
LEAKIYVLNYVLTFSASGEFYRTTTDWQDSVKSLLLYENHILMSFSWNDSDGEESPFYLDGVQVVGGSNPLAPTRWKPASVKADAGFLFSAHRFGKLENLQFGVTSRAFWHCLAPDLSLRPARV